MRIETLKHNIKAISGMKYSIIEQWIAEVDVREILEKHDVDLKVFRTDYAFPVLEYFINVVNDIQDIGQCPAISSLIQYLKEKNISVSELFIICINFRKAIIVNLFQQEKMNGQMYLDISHIFDANFKGVLELFSETIYLEKEKSKKLSAMTSIDYLTKIYNRRKFDELFEFTLKNTLHMNKTFSLVLLDIDFFKKVNDTYGHATGDKVLVAVAKILSLNTRGSDICARWGGEEFIILLPESNLANAMVKAELICKKIKNEKIVDKINITCSAGVTELQDSDDMTSIFERVDSALYSAKKSGRDKIIMA